MRSSYLCVVSGNSREHSGSMFIRIFGMFQESVLFERLVSVPAVFGEAAPSLLKVFCLLHVTEKLGSHYSHVFGACQILGHCLCFQVLSTNNIYWESILLFFPFKALIPLPRYFIFYFFYGQGDPQQQRGGSPVTFKEGLIPTS